MSKITEKVLKNYMALVASNFRFKLDESFDIIFKLVFEKIKHLEVVELQKKFE